MQEHFYKTLKSFSKVELVFKGSLFIGYGKPVKSEIEAKEFINEIKSIHSDATHNVSAYRIDTEYNFAMKYDDDGEPQGSAGKPIYKVIELKNLQNTVIVITRYFGGVKLGYGGLVNAYSDTATEVVNSSGILEVFEKVHVLAEFDYSEIQKVKQIIENFGKIVDENYFDVVKFKIEVKKGLEDELIKKLVNLTKNKIKIGNL
ncbi:putative YigZ family protein [Methanococcus maripaludis]|uniref:Putative YigZ family protein n=1 Tax=Methanococcus maripaludis TaxID=39152 RepID=A0A7J9PG57_METMI|nr:putative YigZ family protein [Methanococcus maripaludis]